MKMDKKKLMSGIMIALMVASAFAGTIGIVSDDASAWLSNPGAITPWVGGPIAITQDSDFDAGHGISNPAAAGTAGDPYIIENWYINCGNASDGIDISGTITVHFIIRNCFIQYVDGFTGIDIDGSAMTSSFDLENIMLNDGGTAIDISDMTTGATVQRVTVDDFTASGISLSGANVNGITIQDCIVTYAHTAAAGDQQAVGAYYGTNMNNITIDNVTISDSGVGIRVYQDGATPAHGWEIKNCHIANTTIVGATDPRGMEITGNYHKIDGNWINGPDTGINIWDGVGCYLANNTIFDTDAAGGWSGANINMENSDWADVYNNVLINGSFGIRAKGAGIDDGEIHNNSVKRCTNGIAFSNGVSRTVVYNNFIYANSNNAVDEDTNNPPENWWNETYANGGGNYWGDYMGWDNHSGPVTPQTTGGPDGFGDTNYTISNATGPWVNDSFPLMTVPDADNQPDVMIGDTLATAILDNFYENPNPSPVQLVSDSVNTSQMIQYKLRIQNDGEVRDDIYILFSNHTYMDTDWLWWVWDISNNTNMTQYIKQQNPPITQLGNNRNYTSVHLFAGEFVNYSINISVPDSANLGQIGVMDITLASGNDIKNAPGEYPAVDFCRIYLQGWLIDNITISETPDGAVIANQTINTGETIQGYASAYNATAGYLGLIEVNWTVTNYNGSSASSTNPVMADNDTFNAGTTSGYAYWQANYTCIYQNMSGSLVTYWVESDAVNVSINAPPVTTLTLGDPNYIDATNHTYINSSTQLNLSVSDPDSAWTTTWYRISHLGSWGGGWIQYTGNLTFATGGMRRMEYNSTDDNMCHEITNFFNFTVENSLPVSTLTITGLQDVQDNITFVDPSTVFNLTATDGNGSGVASIWYQVDALGWNQYTANFSINSGGAHTLYYYAVDNLGQQEEQQHINISVDDTTPISILTIGQPQYGTSPLYVSDQTEFNISATDAVSGISAIMFRVGTIGIYSHYAGNFTISGEGQITIYYYAVDGVGHAETPKQMTVTVDATAPITTPTVGQQNIGTYPIYITSATEINLASTDVYSGVYETYYRIDSGNWTTYTGNFTVAGAGLHTIYYYAMDNLGQDSITQYFEVFIDDDAPTATVTPAPVNGEVTVEAGGTLTLAATDADAGGAEIYYSLDNGTTWNLYTVPVTFDQNTTLLYYTLDALGNQGAQQTVNVVVPGDGDGGEGDGGDGDGDGDAGSDFLSEYWWILIIIVIVAVLLLFILGRKKDDKDEIPPEEEYPQPEPVTEEPPEIDDFDSPDMAGQELEASGSEEIPEAEEPDNRVNEIL